MVGRSGLILAAALLSLCARAEAQAPAAAIPHPEARWTSPLLTPFEDAADFDAYRAALVQAWRAPSSPPSDRPVVIDMNADRNPLTDAEEEPMVIAGSVLPFGRADGPRASDAPLPSGGDEGDVVKQAGRFLLLLKDGRIFSIDTSPAGGGTPVLADRIDLYRGHEVQAQFHALQMVGDRLLVIATPYHAAGVTFLQFRVDGDGRLQAEGGFQLAAGFGAGADDADNYLSYAIRFAGDRLIVHQIFDLDDRDRHGLPLGFRLRRWGADEGQGQAGTGRALLDARDIYRPVRTSFDNMLHVVAICALAPLAQGGGPACRATGLIAPGNRKLYVTPTETFLWADEGYDFYHDWSGTPCAHGLRPDPGATVQGMLFRLPLAGAQGPGVVGVTGHPLDLLSLDVRGGHFRAFERRPVYGCRQSEPSPLALLDLPLDAIGPRLVEAPESRYIWLPGIGTSSLTHLFTPSALVYGGRGAYPFATGGGGAFRGPAVVVPLERPAGARLVLLPHDVIRIVPAGADALLAGYADTSGLDLSLMTLGDVPRRAATVHLAGRQDDYYPRTAINSHVEADGRVLIGVPTLRIPGRDEGSAVSPLPADLDMVEAAPGGHLAALGRLSALPHSPLYRLGAGYNEIGTWHDYHCEVECLLVNTRAIFTGGRVFALDVAELIEGRSGRDRVEEIGRLNLTLPPPLQH